MPVNPVTGLIHEDFCESIGGFLISPVVKSGNSGLRRDFGKILTKNRIFTENLLISLNVKAKQRADSALNEQRKVRIAGFTESPCVVKREVLIRIKKLIFENEIEWENGTCIRRQVTSVE